MWNSFQLNLGYHTIDSCDPLRRNRHTVVAAVAGQLSQAVLALKRRRRGHAAAANPATADRAGGLGGSLADLQ